MPGQIMLLISRIILHIIGQKEKGIYQIKLTNLDSGNEITDSFEVRDSVPFEIERIGSTRIWQKRHTK